MFFEHLEVLLDPMAEADEELPHGHPLTLSFSQAFYRTDYCGREGPEEYLSFSCHLEMDFKWASQSLYTGVRFWQ